jgi:hypothetical protein
MTEETPRRTSYDILRDEISEVKDLLNQYNTHVQLFSQKADAKFVLVDKHERVLFRQNGNPGLIEVVEDLTNAEKDRLEKEREAERDARKAVEDRAAEWRKFRLGLFASVILLAINIALNLLGWM